MEVEKWDPPQEIQDNWRDIEIDAYKLMYSRAIDKYEDILSENEVITRRTQRLATIFFSIILLMIGSTYKNSPSGIMIALVVSACIVDLILFYLLLFGTQLVLRGTDPYTMMRSQLIDKYKDAQIKRLYYEEIARLQRSINTNRVAISRRRKNYYGAIIASFIVFAITAILILRYVEIIFRP